MKDELGEQITRKVVELRPKSFSYFKDNDDVYKTQKAQKSVSQKNSEDYKSFLKVFQIINKYLKVKGIMFLPKKLIRFLEV